MDVLGSMSVALRSDSRAQMIHGWLNRAKDEFQRVLSAVSVPSNTDVSVSDTLTSARTHIERYQHIRSIVFARSSGRCRSGFSHLCHEGRCA